jgi:bacterioferritin (cytochrome b1)
MAGTAARPSIETEITREKLVESLNEDLGREYQAILSYVAYSQVLKGAEYMSIAAELKKHAQQELNHALIISTNRLSWRDAYGSSQGCPHF